MRINRYLFLFYAAVFLPLNLFSQIKPAKSVRLEFKSSTQTVKSIIDAIQSQAGFEPVYSSSLSQLDSGVQLDSTSVMLEKAIEAVAKQTSLIAALSDRYVVIKEKKREIKSILSGTVKDQKTGELLSNASVLLVGYNTGTVTNNYGFFSMKIPDESNLIRVSYVGYLTSEILIKENEGENLTIELYPVSIEGDEVMVTGYKSLKMSDNVSGGSMMLTAADIKRSPKFFGEPDVIKSIQMLPGVNSIAEGTSSMSVRGGNFDQNLFILDEAPVYNPSHLLGFYSAFAPEAVQSVEFFKNSIPSQYGGRLSSFTHIRMKEGNMKKFQSKLTFGLIASQATLEFPLIEDQLSVLFSGRYSYAGKTMELLREVETNIHPFSGNIRGYEKGNEIKFHDLNFKMNYILNSENRFYVSFYNGRDRLDYSDYRRSQLLEWGNSAGNFRWNHILNSDLFLNSTVYFSKYDYANDILNKAQKFRWNSEMTELGLKLDSEWFPESNLIVRTGLYSAFHWFEPGIIKPYDEDLREQNSITLDGKKSVASGIYSDVSFRLQPELKLNAGLRLSGIMNLGPENQFSYSKKTNSVIDSVYIPENKISSKYFQLEPRVSLLYEINAQQSLKVSYDRTGQFMHLLSNSSVGMPTDIWLPVSSNVKPSTADQYSAGYSVYLFDNLLLFNSEIFYKNINHIIDFSDNAEVLANKHIESQIKEGKGTSYGIEFYLKKDAGDLTGSVSYTFSKSSVQIDGINNNESYPASYDKPHYLSANLGYQLTQHWNINSIFQYSSGRPVTIPYGVMHVAGGQFLLYTKRNEFRLPDYHRLDFSVSYSSRSEKDSFYYEISFGCYNIYGRKNAFSIYSEANQGFGYDPKFYMIYLFVAVPFVSVQFNF